MYDYKFYKNLIYFKIKNINILKYAYHIIS